MQTDLTFLNVGQPWPPAGEIERFNRYEQNRLLFSGEHENVFKDWSRYLREDQQLVIQFILNFHKRMTTLFCDLMLVEPPKIAVPDDKGKEFIEKITADNALQQTAYTVAIDAIRYGDGLFYPSRRADGTVRIGFANPTCWIPVVNPEDVSEYTHHVLVWKRTINRTDYLTCQIHTPGQIERRVYLLYEGVLKEQVDLETLYPDGVKEFEDTGLKTMMLFPASNLRTSEMATGMDDYTDLDSLVQEAECRLAQIARILDKHADPDKMIPDSGWERDPKTGQWTVIGGGKAFRYDADNPNAKPEFITWDGNLEAAFTELEKLCATIAFVAELGPALDGLQKDGNKAGTATSGTALRRMWMIPLLRVARLRMTFDPALRMAIRAAGALAGVKVDPSIEWADGLPNDPLEMAQVEAARTGNSQTTSQKRAIMRLDGVDDATAEEIIKEIQEEQKANAPAEPTPRVDLNDSGGEE